MPINYSKAIGVYCPDQIQLNKCRQLADQLSLTLTSTREDFHYLLTFTNNKLQLQQTGPGAPGPVLVDFADKTINYRRVHGGGRNQSIAKAAGLKKNPCPTVLDATAGLGRDAFVLATLGCQVHLLERCPLIAALLNDGLTRGLNQAEIAPIIRRMHLWSADLIGDNPVNDKIDIIYLDPMYPHRRKNALVKKEMRLLRDLVGNDEDAPELLASALEQQPGRVVVKRPKGAPAINGPAPSFIIKSRNSRFDIYLAR